VTQLAKHLAPVTPLAVYSRCHWIPVTVRLRPM
jgi:hypothetical protein